jgi:quercetin dioxygenase-like cupin family protein
MKIILVFLLFVFTQIAYSQEHICFDSLQPVESYANISVQELDADSLVSTFSIWVKKEVRSHKHEFHSETIYVVSGTGKMTVGEKSFVIKTGDYVFIPKNTFHALTVTSEEPVQVLSVQAPYFDGSDRVFQGD